MDEKAEAAARVPLSVLTKESVFGYVNNFGVFGEFSFLDASYFYLVIVKKISKFVDFAFDAIYIELKYFEIFG